MGIFSRLGSLIKSNLNDLISKAEDPEKMLNQVLVDMRNQLIEAKKQVAVAIADEKRLKKQLDQETATSQEWERKAMLAVRAGDDGLAKEALVRRQEHEGLAGQYQQQWDQQRDAVEKLKDALRMLNAKIEEAQRKKNILIARAKRAEAQKTIQQTMQGLQNASAFETFDRMAEKVDLLEAQAEAGLELTDGMSGDMLKQRFAQLEAGPGVDRALEDLKVKMGLLQAPSEAPAQLSAPGEAAPEPAPQLESGAERPQAPRPSPLRGRDK
jgi:phage shock protein A